jgi:hypothetical protein
MVRVSLEVALAKRIQDRSLARKILGAPFNSSKAFRLPVGGAAHAQERRCCCCWWCCKHRHYK